MWITRYSCRLSGTHELYSDLLTHREKHNVEIMCEINIYFCGNLTQNSIFNIKLLYQQNLEYIFEKNNRIPQNPFFFFCMYEYLEQNIAP